MYRQALFALTLLSVTLPASARQTPDLERAIVRADSILDPLDRADAPGLAVAVVRGGRIVYRREVGMASLEQRTAIGPETIFDLGSVSKQLTAYAVVLLEQSGRLDLDRDIRTVLPEVPDFGTPITVRHLVHHLSGIREIYDALGMAGLRSGDGIRQEDALRLVSASRELNFEPGSRYLYCNTAYMLLADIVTRVTGTPFPEWMRDNVFDPLGMEHTVIMDRPGLVIPGAADSYAPDDEGGFARLFDNSSITGAGGVYSTTGDMTRWMANLVSGSEAVMRMRERGVLTTGDTLTYAFGVQVGRTRGLESLSHNGASAGYRSLLVAFPDARGGVVALSNRADVPFEAVVEIRDLFFEDLYTEAPGERVQAPREETEFVPVSRSVLLEYEGKYFSPELETVYTVTAMDSMLVLRHRRVDPLEFRPLGDDRFDGDYPMGRIEFGRDDSGRVTYFAAGGGRVLRMRFDRMD